MKYLYCNENNYNELTETIESLESWQRKIAAKREDLQYKKKVYMDKKELILSGFGLVITILFMLGIIPLATGLVLIIVICLLLHLVKDSFIQKDIQAKQELNDKINLINTAKDTIEMLIKNRCLIEYKSLCGLSNFLKQNRQRKIELSVRELSDEYVSITAKVRADNFSSEDGSAIFHRKEKDHYLKICKETCAKIFPTPDICDLSWLDGETAKTTKSIEELLFSNNCLRIEEKAKE